ncbi:MAG TPA: hypothetical protein VEU96_12680 [Bryobacteraceae bacterium]|nr:hypothetical protein [Bryobacteraceae bacterium]
MEPLLGRSAIDNSKWTPGFTDGYDKSDATTFVSATVTKGHAQLLAGYLKRYPADLEMKLLGSDYASVLGRFHLHRSAEAGREADGIFTLPFHKTPHCGPATSDTTSWQRAASPKLSDCKSIRKGP